MMRRALTTAALLVATATLAVPAASQDLGDATTTTSAAPRADIVPQPNSGAEPSEPGDRGGALQVGVLSAVVVALGAGVAGVVRQSRRARGQGAGASQADVPSRNPDR